MRQVFGGFCLLDTCQNSAKSYILIVPFNVIPTVRQQLKRYSSETSMNLNYLPCVYKQDPDRRFLIQYDGLIEIAT